jgi:hypothetical protein
LSRFIAMREYGMLDGIRKPAVGYGEEKDGYK